MMALKKLNARAIELQDTSSISTQANQRFTFAVYFYHEKEDLESKQVYEEGN
jgi:hypothetical protein